MGTFDYTFTVDAPLQAVTDFHSRTDILKKLTPPPLFVQVEAFGEMQEGMVARFTIWAGPIPLRWVAKHVNVSQNGFTDVQQSGPMQTWAHTHTFTALSADTTRVDEHIEYSYPAGLKGIFARLMFNPAGLRGLFFYRKLITTRTIKQTLKS